jgi:hypothetical protein
VGGVHAGDGVRIIERCKPLDISERVRESAELGRESENDTDLCGTKT